ncbi:MAG: hypothetical protein CSB55_06175 [Candidatus Cloacimonadota bacterium]|nr:MAG: hypothetical protein CSB55_06175 [Candidatus Cloacimonadota bacterium]
MKQIILFLFLLIALIGCSSEGDLKIINKTSHEAYITLDNKNYTLNPEENISFSYKLGKKYPFGENPSKKKLIYLKGETFRLWDHTTDNFTEFTYVTVNRGKTARIFMNPTDAAAKLTNNSNKIISYFAVEGGKTNENVQIIKEAYNIKPGESAIFYLPYKNGNVTYHYRAFAQGEDGSFYESSSPEQYKILTLDDLILIEVNN